VVSVSSGDPSALEKMALQSGIPCKRIGTVGGTRLKINTTIDVEVSDLRDQWEKGLEVSLRA